MNNECVIIKDEEVNETIKILINLLKTVYFYKKIMYNKLCRGRAIL